MCSVMKLPKEAVAENLCERVINFVVFLLVSGFF